MLFTELFNMCNNTIIDSNMMIRTEFMLSEEENSTLQNVYFWGDGVLGSLLSIIGLVMNVLAIYILMTREELKHMTTDLLCYLLWIENAFLFTRLINLCYFDFGFQHLAVIIPHGVYPLENMALTMAVFLMVCLAHQGYLITMNMRKYESMLAFRKRCQKMTVRYMLPVVLCSLLINIPRFFCYRIVNNENSYQVVRTEVRKNFHFVVLYDNFVCNVLTMFAPITLLLFFNWNIYLFLDKKGKEIEDWDMDSSIYKKNKTHIDILFIIIALFVICHFPRCFLKFYEVFYEPFWIKVLGTIERLLLIVHFSANSFIYMIKNDTFRKHIFLISKKLFCLLTFENRTDV